MGPLKVTNLYNFSAMSLLQNYQNDAIGEQTEFKPVNIETYFQKVFSTCYFANYKANFSGFEQWNCGT